MSGQSDKSGKLVAVVLAAGQGTRMRSSMAKVRHEILGRPMVAYPVHAAFEAGADRVVLVVGHQAAETRAAVEATFPDAELGFALQAEQRGTGHAVQAALEADATRGFDDVLILYGDTPALDGATLRALRAAHASPDGAEARPADMTVLTFEASDPTGYGRVVRDDQGRPRRIVEHRDASDAERRITEVNAGMVLVRRELLAAALAGLGRDNAQGEIYLTDVVERLAGDGHLVRTFSLPDGSLVAGVNTRAQLARIEEDLRRRRCHELMEAGVTMQDPPSTRIEAGVEIGRDTVLGPGVQLLGRTRLGEGCRVEAGCVLRDCTLGDGVHLKPYVVGEQATLGDGTAAGPFTHMRPGTALAARARLGNFVETKKAVIGEGSKANHLSYLGDCEIGRGVNVGAGTITCNYDGFDKHRTVLEDGVFVGSDTQLVAPVRVGRNVTIAAGTTVTRDVPEGALAVSRVKQDNKEGHYALRRQPREEARAQRKAAERAAREATGRPGDT